MYSCASLVKRVWIKAVAEMATPVGREDNKPRGSQPSFRLPRKSFSSNFARWKREESASVTFLAEVLPCPLQQHMGRLGGCRRTEPLRLPERPGRKDLHRRTAGKDTKLTQTWEIIYPETEILDRDSEPFRLPVWGCIIAPPKSCALEGLRARQRNLDFSGRLVFMQKPSTATL